MTKADKDSLDQLVEGYMTYYIKHPDKFVELINIGETFDLFIKNMIRTELKKKYVAQNLQHYDNKWGTNTHRQKNMGRIKTSILSAINKPCPPPKRTLKKKFVAATNKQDTLIQSTNTQPQPQPQPQLSPVRKRIKNYGDLTQEDTSISSQDDENTMPVPPISSGFDIEKFKFLTISN